MRKIFLLIFIFIFQISYGHSISLPQGNLEIKDNKIIDSYGNSVEKKAYQKIIITDPAIVEIFYILEAEENILAIANPTLSGIYPEEKTDKLTRVGTIRNPSIEMIVSLEPDLVITYPGTTGLAADLKNMDIPVLTTIATNIDRIYENIELCGIVTGKEELAQKIITQSKNKVESHREKNKDKKKIRGIILFSTSPMMTFSDATLPGEVLQILGVENIANQTGMEMPILSNEFILEENPDFIAGSMSINDLEDLKKSIAILADTKAFKKGNLFIIDSNKIVRGSPRIFEAIDELAEILAALNLEDN